MWLLTLIVLFVIAHNESNDLASTRWHVEYGTDIYLFK